VNSNDFAIRARWLFPVATPPISGGVLTVHAGRIAAVGENLSGAPPIELGDAAIIPGLVNAHTHLEFSELANPLGRPGMPLPEWVAAVIAWRRLRDESPDAGAERRQNAVEQGLRECLAGGVATLGEIAAPGWREAPFRNSPIDCTIFQELLGLEPERRSALVELAKEHLAAGTRGGDWRPALSPHAPYTAPLELVEAAAEISRRSGAPLAMHVAESPEELELLLAGTGPFRELLESVSPRLPELIPPNLRPLDFLQRLAGGARTLAIHGNYLDEEELTFLAEHSATMSVVYCPRTHDYFRHAPYPLAKMLRLGIGVALGTDSRASNPDLSLWEDMRFVAQRYSAVPPSTVLRLGTQSGAEALGLADECGTLAPGKRADYVAFQLPSGPEGDPHSLLFDDAARLLAVGSRGALTTLDERIVTKRVPASLRHLD
jgi:aminodeoxyfutalosine deaminase